MCDFTRTLKGVVDKAASVARDMAQDATDMKDTAISAEDVAQDESVTEVEAEENTSPAVKDDSPTVLADGSSSDATACELDMSPISGESKVPQKLAESMETQPMDSAAKMPAPGSSSG